LLTTGVYGAVKVAATIFYVAYLVDRVGRRLPLLIGATIQATAMLYLALYLRFAGTDNTDMSGTPAGGIVGIIWIYLYAFGWSFGHSVACYIVAAEIFPTRIVSTLLIFPFLNSCVITIKPLHAAALGLHGLLLLHQLDNRLRYHAGDAKYADEHGLRGLSALCPFDVPRSGIHFLLPSRVEGAVD
jgi:hypothetical protein